jgi:hypothetical protein
MTDVTGMLMGQTLLVCAVALSMRPRPHWATALAVLAGMLFSAILVGKRFLGLKLTLPSSQGLWLEMLTALLFVIVIVTTIVRRYRTRDAGIVAGRT